MMSLRRCLMIIFTVIIFVANALEINAVTSGFSTEELSREDQETFVSNINIQLLLEVSEERGIQHFDVNEEGMIAIVQAGKAGKELHIYSSDGTFLYGYVFNCSGDCGVEWDSKNINIYFVRSDVILTVDSDANIIDVERVQDTIENNTYRNHLLYSTHREIGDTTYSVGNSMRIFDWISPTYSRIIATTSAGEVDVLYDVSQNQLAAFLTLLVIVVLLLLSVAIIVVWKERGTRGRFA